jgi:two-component system nitrogen regulation response regulator NtrX
MTSGTISTETILIVDDEEPVRRTFREWLEAAQLGCQLLEAADAEEAVRLANEHTIDLAILDWNLGAGHDGLQLLEDLTLFNPDIVAIMVTGFAHQATPLDAMRMGVRDYLDKNHDLDRPTFVRAVHKQLERIRPARRQRQLHQQLVAFRATVEKVVPLVQASAALHDPVPLPAAISNLFRFLVRTTRACDGILLLRGYDPDRDPAEVIRVYDREGEVLFGGEEDAPSEPRTQRSEPGTQRSGVSGSLVPFSRSLAGSVLSLQEPCLMNDLSDTGGNFALQPFERGRRSLLAAPLGVGPGLQAVVELFDKQGEGAEFTREDRQLVAAAADFGAEMLRQALAERQTQRVLLDAVAAALAASETVAESLQPGQPPRPEDPPPPVVLERLQQGLRDSADETGIPAVETLRLAEAIRVLALQHGPAAITHCIRLIESLRDLLDEITGLGEPSL